MSEQLVDSFAQSSWEDRSSRSRQQQLDGLRDRHHAAEIWVLGSGPSLVRATIPDDAVIVGVNLVGLLRRVDYAVVKHHCDVEPLLARDVVVVVSKRDCGFGHTRQLSPALAKRCCVFEHLPNQCRAFSWPRGESMLVVSWSTITSALHFAAHLGAARIVITGHDCGAVDGRWHVNGYAEAVESVTGAYDAERAASALDWKIVASQTTRVIRHLQKRYSVEIDWLHREGG